VQDRWLLHLATHGLVEQAGRQLFAALALAPGDQAERWDDGLLELSEVYALPLAGVELAVLSACQTNVGLVVQGEGVYALSRGFLVAGAHRVVASQWAVVDASTGVLMGVFLGEVVRAHVSGAALDYGLALQRSRRWVRSQPQWSSPHYWAPFILMGRE
jgi:CHAT domain-containing protein